MDTVDIGGVRVGVGDRRAFVAELVRQVESGRPHHHLSLNAAKWVRMRHDPTLRRVAREATTVGADGASILWAARRARVPLPERVTGCDLALDLLDEAARRGWRVALLGAAPDVLGEVRERLTARGVDVVAARDGFFAEDEERAVVRALADAKPQLLLVAMGTPRSERFLARWGPVLAAPLVMGVGGTFDVIAGRARRAPAAIGAAGLEWAWRWAGAPRARLGPAWVGPVAFVLATLRGARLPDDQGPEIAPAARS